MNSFATVATVYLVWLAGVSAAGTPGSRTIEEAAGAFAGLDFERALELLERAQNAGGNSPGDMVRIYSLRGLCLVSLGRQEQARRNFRAALSIDPGFRLAPDLSPRFQEPFREELERGVSSLSVRMEFPPGLQPGQEVRGTLELASDPEGLAGWLVVFHRPSGRQAYSSTRLPPPPAGKTVPFLLEPFWEGSRDSEFLEWYAELLDGRGNRLLLRGDAEHPLRVPCQRLRENLAIAPPPPPAAPAAAALPWYRQWWVWAIAGTLAAAAGGVTAGVLLSQPAPRDRDFKVEIR